MNNNKPLYQVNKYTLRRNSNENEWNSFDQSMESLLGGSNNRPRTYSSSGQAQSPSSTHSDQQPQQLTSTPLPATQQPQHIPVIGDPSLRKHQQKTEPIAPKSTSNLPVLVTTRKETVKDDICHFCPSPPHGHDYTCDDPKHSNVLFTCAACGLVQESYEEVSKHVQDHHVGDDMELVLASIVVPASVDLMKEFQCGIKSCGRRFIGLKEEDLINHIRITHGDYYVKIFNGRNIVRMCRICKGKFESDQALTDHISQWHPFNIFANNNGLNPDPATKVVASKPLMDDIKITKKEEGVNKKVANVKPNSSVRVPVTMAHMDLELPSRKRKNSESVKERLTIAPSSNSASKLNEPKVEELKSNDLPEQYDLKYKLKKIREAKITVRRTYCEACCRTTKDWSNHKFSLEHIQNDKKARCHFCPRRFRFEELKGHVTIEHKGCSFTCNVSKTCNVRLMNLDKLTEHINEKHRDQVDELIRHFGQNWESNFVSSTHLGMNNFYLLPSDLRKLSCRICELTILSQDQSALESHFRQEHPELSQSNYNNSIRFECRVCSGMLFGSETHLLNHFKDVHSKAGLSIDKESDADLSEREERNDRSSRDELIRRLLKTVGSEEESHLPTPKTKSSVSMITTPVEMSSPLSPIKAQELKYKINQRKKPSKRKLNTFSSTVSSKNSRNIVVNYKKMYSDLMENKSSNESDDSNEPFATCNFCEMKLSQSSLKSHMKKFHKNNLFVCDGSCGKKFYSAWRNDVLSHLKLKHHLNLSDKELCEEHMTLPDNLAIISCKANECDTEAIFLAREISDVEKMLTRHAEKRHRGLKIEDCYNLGCRVCTFVWDLSDIRKWEHHCRKHHGLTYEKSSKKPNTNIESDERATGDDEGSVNEEDIEEGRVSNSNTSCPTCSNCSQTSPKEVSKSQLKENKKKHKKGKKKGIDPRNCSAHFGQ